MTADVRVLGAGPAGCAAAIVLAGAGLRVRLVARPREGPPIGETLSPGAAAMLRALGVGDAFVADGHLPCYANASAWGSSALAFHDFVRDPRGHAWHLDRGRFDARLLDRAREAGVEVVDSPAGLCEGPAGALPGGVRWTVDATGRAAVHARACGVERLVAWEQVAAVGFGATTAAPGARPTLIEAVPDGFWYTAPLPRGRLVAALFTDAPLLRGPDGDWLARLGATTHTRARWEGLGARLEGPVRVVAAGSGRLSRAHGADWVAVGDAAMAYDPLSAHGLTLALRTGIDGANALLGAERGDPGALPAYAARLDGAWRAYRREVVRLFRAEARWPSAPYWARRRALAEEEPAGEVSGE